MKKTIVTAIIILIGFGLKAQDVKSAKKLFDKGDLTGAQAQVNAFVTANPNNAEGLFLKAKIYEAIAAKEMAAGTESDAGAIAFENFKKGMDNSKDSKEIMIEMFKDKNFYSPLINLYSDFYKAGLKYFNSGVASKNPADYGKAVAAFIMANNVGKFATANKLTTLGEIDTALVLNIGQSAIYAENNATAESYFKLLADNNIHGTKDGSAGYQLPYEWLAQYYRDKKDETNFTKYVEKGKQYFPNDKFFDLVMLDFYRNKKEFPNLFKKYDDLINKNPDSINYNLSYAAEVYAYVYGSSSDTKIENKDQLLKAASVAVEKVIKIEPNNIKANWLMGQYYYNMGIETRQAANDIKSTSKVPADIKKKADLNVSAKQYFNQAIPYLDKAITEYEATSKKSNKSSYKSVVNLALQNYEQLMQPEKVKFYQQKYDNADTKFVN